MSHSANAAACPSQSVSEGYLGVGRNSVTEPSQNILEVALSKGLSLPKSFLFAPEAQRILDTVLKINPQKRDLG